MITGSVQINKGYYFIVLNMYNEYGKRKPEWHSTGLKVDNNERKNQQNKKINRVIELYLCLILLLIY